MKMHKSITTDRVVEAIKRRNLTLDNPGICKACGHEQEGCEPDAEDYECEACGEMAVDGVENLGLHLL